MSAATFRCGHPSGDADLRLVDRGETVWCPDCATDVATAHRVEWTDRGSGSRHLDDDAVAVETTSVYVSWLKHVHGPTDIRSRVYHLRGEITTIDGTSVENWETIR